MDAALFDGLRRDYGDEPLAVAGLPAEPLALVRQWLSDAAAAGLPEPNAMALATVSADGQPHCRFVLLKQLDDRGFAFFTNRGSDKGVQLGANPRAAATFWWPVPRNRQVRVVGSVVPTDEATTDRYFASRPRDAQIAAAASPQSSVITSRADLDRMVADLAERIGDNPVPRPPQWGGYVLVPHSIEFWQGRRARLHDRLRYRRDSGGWTVERLAP